MAFDSYRRRVVLFSGDGLAADTWEWDGMLWVKKAPANSPPARYRAAMVYDAKRRRVVLFGGRDNSNSRFGDTWEWDGIAWVKKSPNDSPSPRYGAAMAYDSDREVVVLFGGYDGQSRDDTWEWDGQNWKQLSLIYSPFARWGASMVYDSARKRIVLVGGDGRSDIWELASGIWTQKPVDTRRRDSAVAFDGLLGRTVMFGGWWNSNSEDTLTWDGNTLVNFPTRAAPSGRQLAQLVYDSARRRLVMFGGQGFGALGDTWELVHDCRCVALGHPGGGLPLTCVSAPLVGHTLRVAFPSSQRLGYLLFGGAPYTKPWLLLNPPLVCRPGTLQFEPFRLFPGFGDPIVFDFPIPNDLRLADTRLLLQGVSLQVGCFLATDAIEVTLRGF